MTDDEFDELMRLRLVVDWERYIQTDLASSYGKPITRGTRLSAEFILQLYGGGLTDAEVLENYSHLDREAIRAVFAFAAQCVSEKGVPPLKSTSVGTPR